jgi:hypothetical protein
MSYVVSEALARLNADPWRQECDFTEELVTTNQQLFAANGDDEVSNILNNWMSLHQPCLFGRHAAKIDMLSYCILTETDLKRDDRYIRDKIQSKRRDWLHDAFNGLKSGFVILALSERIALALPTSTQELAQRLCSLYLLKPIQHDQIYLDAVELEIPGQDSPTFRWDAGVNYFCAQGDGRWWRDHRIPGGLAFSVNSVGHMVKSTKVSIAMQEVHTALGVTPEEWSESTIDSLGKALLVAMQTINRAAQTPDGRATELLPLPEDSSNFPICPIALPASLASKDYCSYFGRYHTDWTLPSEYFRDDVRRPPGLPTHILDFTYLFDSQLDNPDFINVGEGRQIRADEGEVEQRPTIKELAAKRRRAVGRVVDRDDFGY